MGAGGTATTECPPNRGPGWKHESPDYSRGENQEHGMNPQPIDLMPIHNGDDDSRIRNVKASVREKGKKRKRGEDDVWLSFEWD